MNDLPEKPIDGFTIDFWTIHDYGDAYEVRHGQLVYHVNTPRIDVIGRDGVPCCDDWAIIENVEDGRVAGRNPGWLSHGVANWFESFPHFETREKAEAALTNRAKRTLERWAQEKEKAEAWLAKETDQ